MTVSPVRLPRPHTGLRVLSGRRPIRLLAAPWFVVSLVAVVAFLGLVLTRTALDRGAVELATIERQIAEQTSLNQRLRLEIGRLESPARIAPLAEDMGMVFPLHSVHLSVAGVVEDTPADPRWSAIQRLEQDTTP